MTLAEALALGVDTLSSQNGERLDAARLESALLDRSRRRRKFRRLGDEELGELL
jgi:hypothetical protein